MPLFSLTFEISACWVLIFSRWKWISCNSSRYWAFWNWLSFIKSRSVVALFTIVCKLLNALIWILGDAWRFAAYWFALLTAAVVGDGDISLMKCDDDLLALPKSMNLLLLWLLLLFVVLLLWLSVFWCWINRLLYWLSSGDAVFGDGGFRYGGGAMQYAFVISWFDEIDAPILYDSVVLSKLLLSLTLLFVLWVCLCEIIGGGGGGAAAAARSSPKFSTSRNALVLRSNEFRTSAELNCIMGDLAAAVAALCSSGFAAA